MQKCRNAEMQKCTDAGMQECRNAPRHEGMDAATLTRGTGSRVARTGPPLERGRPSGQVLVRRRAEEERPAATGPAAGMQERRNGRMHEGTKAGKRTEAGRREGKDAADTRHRLAGGADGSSSGARPPVRSGACEAARRGGAPGRDRSRRRNAGMHVWRGKRASKC